MSYGKKVIKNCMSLLDMLNGVRTISPEENCPPHNCSPRKIPPWMIAPWKIAPEVNCLPDNYPRGKLPPSPGKLRPHHKISLENNCTHSSKFPSKGTTSELKKTKHCLRVL